MEEKQEYRSYCDMVSQSPTLEDAVAECGRLIVQCRMEYAGEEHNEFFQELLNRYNTEALPMYTEACALSENGDLPESAGTALSAAELCEGYAGELDDFVVRVKTAIFNQANKMEQQARHKCRQLAFSLPEKFADEALYSSPEYDNWQQTRKASEKAYFDVPPGRRPPAPWNM